MGDAVANFISHYVQIKPISLCCCAAAFPYFISHYVQIKRVCGDNETLRLINFISHYVQIKRQSVLDLQQDVLSLYPTTFR